jgi:type IV pilus assembly protein PilC
MPRTTHKHFSKTFRAKLIRFPVREQILFVKRLSFLIRAGVPVAQGLSLIRQQTRSRNQSRMFGAILSDVRAGQFLAPSLKKFEQYFGEFTVNIISIGEHAGILSENLLYLGEELSKKHALKKKVYGALIYPAVITLTTLGITGMLTMFIFPKIMPLFISLNVSLPITTRMVLSVSTFISDYGWWCVLALILLVLICYAVRFMVPQIHIWSDWLTLKLPIAGSIARSYNIANICRTLGILLRSGIVISEAVLITSDATHNRVFKRVLNRIAVGVRHGKTVSHCMHIEGRLFPDMVTHMVAVGEQTGSLTDTLKYVSDFYEADVDEKTKNLSQVIEPLLLVTMGLIVGLIAISVITPIYEITQTLER